MSEVTDKEINDAAKLCPKEPLEVDGKILQVVQYEDLEFALNLIKSNKNDTSK